ncbi:MAG: right-handed parallel beta-helix repeat-containing protein [Woeseiaceae bacterium]|nr:right-handed parallel beta-helix repeat-containing protein [Woeseiaceae bacterium]
MNKTKTTTWVLAALAAIAMFLISASVLAATPENRGDHARSIERTTADHESIREHSRRRLRVRCDRGETLTKALRRARAYQTIRFSGTCYESIVIKTDHLTLRGENGATIDGGASPSEAVVLIDGARGVRLANFTVQNGADQGVLATHQSQGELKNLAITGNGTVGLSVDRSHLEIIDLALDNNRVGGMDAYTGSTIVARGSLSANNNGGDGLAANGRVFFELRGAQIVASGNAGSGISIINDSRLQILSFPEAQGSSINADGNGFAGIGILGSALGVVGSQFFGSGANVITANNNGVFGFFMPAGAILSPHATAKFVAQENGVGMLLEDGGTVLIVGGLDLAENGAGLSAHGAGTLTLVSVPPNPSRIDDNRIDLDLGFGTRLTSDAVRFTSIACDETVLTRGASCPGE